MRAVLDRKGNNRVLSHLYLAFYNLKRTLMGTPNREPQEYSGNIIAIYLPGSVYSIIFLLYSWGSLFGVPIKVPLYLASVDPATP